MKKARVTGKGNSRGVTCGCGHHTIFGLYATAQMAQGNSLVMTCQCGNKVSLDRFAITGESKDGK